MQKQKQKHQSLLKLIAVMPVIIATALLYAVAFLRYTPVLAVAGTNETVNYQGRLLTATGAVVPDGNYNMEFKITQDGDGCNPTSGTFPCSGTVKWTETREGSNKVLVKNGYFSIYLGSVTAFGSSVDWNQDTLWLSINIGGTATPSYDGAMKPLTRLSSTPYSLNSKMLGGLVKTDFVQLALGVQTDSSTTAPSIFINKTGITANILQLQRNSSDVLVVDNAGVLISSAGIILGANQNLTTTAGTGTIVLNSTVSNASDEAILITPSFTGGATDLLTYNGVSLAAFSPTNATGTDTVNGIKLGNLTDPGATITSNAFNIGSGWDTIFNNNGTLISSAELNLLDGRDVALVDTNDAVATAITGTGVLGAGSIANGFGAIDVGVDNITTTGTIGTAGSTTFTGAGATFTTAVAANGGITFDNATDTLGAHTLSGTLDANANILTNIGNTGTDFIASTGALTLAGVLTANGGVTLGANQNLTMQSGTGTFTQTYTGTTNDAYAIIANSLTTGSALDITSTNNTASATGWSGNIFNITNAQGTTATSVIGLNVQFNQTATVAGNTESVANFSIAANASTPTDSTVNSILNLNNNDTATGNQITATNGLLITGTNITNGINLSGTFGTNLITSSNFVVAQSGVITSAGSAGVGRSCGGTQTLNGIITVGGIVTGGTCSNNLTDIAEQYDSYEQLEPGDIVAPDTTAYPYVKKTTSPHQFNTMGIVSTAPYRVLGDANPGYPIGLIGRVPTKVNLENGPINSGDYVTSSSTPGYGMKATQSGQVVGIALESYDGSQADLKITVFLLPGYQNFDTPTLASNSTFLSGLANRFDDEGNATLKNIMAQTVDTTFLTTSKITAGPDGNLHINLGAGGQFVITGESGQSLATIDSSGNANFTGTVTAQNLISRDANNSLDSQVLSAYTDVYNQLLAQVQAVTNQGYATSAAVSTMMDDKLIALFANNIEFSGTSLFRGNAKFLESVSFASQATFYEEVLFKGRLVFSNDNGGFATIVKNDNEIRIIFNKPFSQTPVVNVNNTDGQFVDYTYKDLTKDGFTIVLKTSASKDITFSWTAFAIDNALTQLSRSPAPSL